MSDGPTAVVRCENQRCPYNGQQRDVPYTAVGPGLWAMPANVTCDCGQQPRTLDRWQPHPAPRKAVATPPERRSGRPRKARG